MRFEKGDKVRSQYNTGEVVKVKGEKVFVKWDGFGSRTKLNQSTLAKIEKV